MNDNNSGTNLAKVLSYYKLALPDGSMTQKIVCPFHDDVNPSLIVNYEDGSWFCFGCNCSGDANKFVSLMERKYHRLNDLQSYKIYLRILSSEEYSDIKVSHNTSSRRTRGGQRQLYIEAYDYYYGLKKVNWRNPVESEAVDALDYMTKRGFTSKALTKCKAKITYNSSYGLIFPMLDNGKFKGWVCRTMIKSVESKRKYLYNEGFSRATTLVGSYGSKDYVFVVEGFMDRLKFVQFGEENVVAILGWKMSEQQISKLKEKGVTKVISALDNDECGRKGTAFLKKHFDVTRFAYIKGIKDPGDMTKENFNKMFRRTMKKFESKQ